MSSRMCQGNKISLTLFGASSPDYHPCGVDKQTNTCFLQVNIGAKTQCLSKEIGVGVAIPCWRRSQLIVKVQVAHLSEF